MLVLLRRFECGREVFLKVVGDGGFVSILVKSGILGSVSALEVFIDGRIY